MIAWFVPVVLAGPFAAARERLTPSALYAPRGCASRQPRLIRSSSSSVTHAVLEDHVYVDDGISGTEFARCPGFLRLMHAIRPRRTFDMLIMSEESRLGRDAIETAYALKQLIQPACACSSSTSNIASVPSTPLPTSC